MIFKNTRIAWSRLLTAGRRLFAAAHLDLSLYSPRNIRPAKPSYLPVAEPKATSKDRVRPHIFVSYATDENLKGSDRYCGGEKLLNNLVLLLRRHGYEAWMVSIDGKNAGWLAEHAPFLSLAEFQERLRSAPDARCVSSWIKARAFLNSCPDFYFWDQELAASARSHFPKFARLMARKKIRKMAGLNRSVQAWHQVVFERESSLLRPLVDEKYWQPDPARRISSRVGYFDEGEHSADYIRLIRERTSAAGLELEFHRLQGDEPVIISEMQTCAIFLALNIGKSPLWGEGGPMGPLEAMSCGTIPICFDMNGPWEVIQQNYNGVVTQKIDPNLMADALLNIYGEPGRLEMMSQRCLEMTKTSHTMKARWVDVCKFLDLPE